MRLASRALAIVSTLFFGALALTGTVSSLRYIAGKDFGQPQVLEHELSFLSAVLAFWVMLGLSLLLLRALRSTKTGSENDSRLLTDSLGTLLFGFLGLALLLSILHFPPSTGDAWRLLTQSLEGCSHIAAGLVVALLVLYLSVRAIRRSPPTRGDANDSKGMSLGFKLVLILVLLPIPLLALYYVPWMAASGMTEAALDLSDAGMETSVGFLSVAQGIVFLLLAYRSLSRLRLEPKQAPPAGADHGEAHPAVSQ